MQTRNQLMILGSLGALAVGFWLGRLGGNTPVPRASAAAVTESADQPPNAPRAPAPAEPGWAQLESSDYVSYVANLRRIGCPEQTIRDIIVADICNLYSQEWKRKHLAAKPHYWDPEFGLGPIQSDELQHAAAQVQQILRDHVRQVLGVDLDQELEKFRAIGATQLGDEFLLSGLLSPEKAATAAQALDKHRAVRRSVENTGFLTAEGVGALKRSRENLRRDLRAFLSPEEITQVEYRCSAAAQEIRDKMAGFELTEQEFKKIFACRTHGEEQFEASAAQGKAGQPLSADEILKLAADTELSESAVKDAIGPERYAEYQRSQDGRYQHLKGVAAQNNLSPEWVRALYDSQRAVEESAKGIREDPGLSAEQKESMMQEAHRRSSEQVRLWLGDELARKLQPALTSPR